MFIGHSAGSLSTLENLELRRDRIQELITLQLVSPSLLEQLKKAVVELDRQIEAIRAEPVRLAA